MGVIADGKDSPRPAGRPSPRHQRAIEATLAALEPYRPIGG